MKPVAQTPTERSDYALISLTYAALLTGTAASARGREPLLAPKDLVPLSAATFALSKLIVHEKVETWLRGPFVEETPDAKHPKGRRLRYAIGELFSCTRCMGAWSALGLVALRLHAPGPSRTVTTVLAMSAANDFLQSAFSWMCAQAEKTAIDKDTSAQADPLRHAEDGSFRTPGSVSRPSA